MLCGNLKYFFSFLLLTLFCCLFSMTPTQSAPTHHLSIGVQGNTPTLIVTSSEIGITPQTMDAPLSASALPPAKKEETKNKVTNDAKQKFSKLKSTKKQSHFANRKEKLTTHFNKNLIKNVVSDFTTAKPNKILPNKTVTQVTVSAQLSTLNVEETSTAHQVEEKEIEKSTLPSFIKSSQKLQLPLATEYTTTMATATPLTSSRSADLPDQAEITTIIHNDKVQHDTVELQNESDRQTTEMAASSSTKQPTTIDNEKSTKEFNATPMPTMVAATTNKPEFYTKGIEQELITENAEITDANSRDDNNNADNSPTTTMPNNVATNDGVSHISDINTAATTTDVVADTKMELTTAATYKEQQQDFKEISTEPWTSVTETAMPLASQQNINTKEMKIDAIEANTETETTVSTTEATKLPLTRGIENLKTYQKQPSLTTTFSTQIEHNATPELVVQPLNVTKLKLMDLEKHDLKSADAIKINEQEQQQQQQHYGIDNGHDGFKIIKKKQLVDKHYLEALQHHDEQQFKQQQPAKTAQQQKILNDSDKSLSVSSSSSTAMPLAASATTTTVAVLKPIKHGYLGPILMEEKTFHVVHHNNNNSSQTLGTKPTTEQQQKKKKNSSSFDIEKEIKEKHFVEIIAKKQEEEEDEQDVTTSGPMQSSKEAQHESLVISTTVFENAADSSLATKTPITPAKTMFTLQTDRDKKTESKISDIQIEVYDSMLDSSSDRLLTESNQQATKATPIFPNHEERFTQYVIDRTETSTPESINYTSINLASGRPEPAAIEIHINVSESFGNESEDLEFSFPQAEYNNNPLNSPADKEDEPYEELKVNDNIKLQIPSNSAANPAKERSSEILIVEIIDTDNSTEPQLDLYHMPINEKPRNIDDLFISEVKDDEEEGYVTPPTPPPPPPPYQSNYDRDSDTIFYISNTEVKVGESKPNFAERKTNLENQFFPANYMATTHANINEEDSSAQSQNLENNHNHHVFEEDIILSSSQNQAGSLKIYRNQNEPSPPLDVTYVGESIIEVEQQSPDSPATTTAASDSIATPQPQDVIIQPAILPEISIGVPVIGELPPQIELKEIDFMPNEAQQHHSAIYDNDDSNNIVDDAAADGTAGGGGGGVANNRLEESSIQYGGDLIDESADGGFDGVEGSYPFGNTASIMMRHKQQQQQQQLHQHNAADYSHLYVNYGINNNMRKDELTADVKDSGEISMLSAVANPAAEGVVVGDANEQNNLTASYANKNSINGTSTIQQQQQQPSFMMNYTQSERMSNATAFSVMEDTNDLEEKNTEDIINLISLAIGLFIVILPVVVTCSMLWALSYLYKKYHSNSTDTNGNTEKLDAKGQQKPADDDAEKGESPLQPLQLSPSELQLKPLQPPPPPPPPPSSNCSSVIPNKPDTTPNDVDIIQEYENVDSEKPSMTTENSIKFAIDNETSSKKPILKESSTKKHPSRKCKELSLNLHCEIYSVQDDSSPNGPNGSVTKMTLENNLLIVETEERNDISRVARETKMDYNKAGVFVVEVSRGIDSKTMPESPVTEGSEKLLPMFEPKQNGRLAQQCKLNTSNEKVCHNNEKVQIHSPPPENNQLEDSGGPRSLHQIEEEDVEETAQIDQNLTVEVEKVANTGLSQSDLCSTSSNDSNKDYCYGNQELYVVEQSGYSTMSPTSNAPAKCEDSKEIKDDDRNPENGHYLEHSPDKKTDGDKREDALENIQKNSDKGKEQTGKAKQNENQENVQSEVKKIVQLETVAVSEEEEVNLQIATDKQETLEEEIEKVEEIEQSIDETNTKPDEVIKVEENQNQQECKPEEKALEIKPKELVVEEPQKDLHIPVNSSINQCSSEPMQDPKETKELLIKENHAFNEPEIKSIDTVIPENSTINHCSSEPMKEPEKTRELPLMQNHIFTESEETKQVLNINNEKIITNGISNESLNENYEDNSVPQQTNEQQTNGILNNNEKNELAADIILPPPDILHDLLPSNKTFITHTFNGTVSDNSDNPIETENGYDSLMSLPEPPPPPTIMTNGNDDLTDQLDSLPPPPPPLSLPINGHETKYNESLLVNGQPEQFNLKDLPPPLENGHLESPPHSDHETNGKQFYATQLPPPTPPPAETEMETTSAITTALETSTTLQVTKLHDASPLTPPASPSPPPAQLYTATTANGIHHAGGLCHPPPPIAVDVNGS